METTNGLLPVKLNRINHYMRGEGITTIKDGLESSNDQNKQLFYSCSNGILYQE
jgi:hypothetical protein